MHYRKKDIIQFLAWMRNGITFVTTWFLILILMYNHFFHIQTISTSSLTKLVCWIAGGVFIFNLFFTTLIIKKWSFIKRLTWFMSAMCLYECFGFYWLHFFQGRGTPIQWFIFIGIIFVLYLICIAIYQTYSNRQGEVYTQALQKYQQQRSREDGR